MPGMTPIKVEGRPKRRMRSGSFGSGTPTGGRVGFAGDCPRYFCDEVRSSSRPALRIVSTRSAPSRLDHLGVLFGSIVPRSGSPRFTPSSAFLGAPQSDLVVDQQRHQPFMITAGAAIDLGNDVADRAGKPIGCVPFRVEPSARALDRRQSLGSSSAVGRIWQPGSS